MNIKSSIWIFGLFGLLTLSSCGSKKTIARKGRVKPDVKEQIQPSLEEIDQTPNSVAEVPMTAEQRMSMYIESFAPIAIEEMRLYGIPASITLAQGILESGSGSGTLAIKANNHFGIKCHTTWTGERVYHDDDELGECFRKYTDVKYSYRDHSLFLTQRSRYADLFKLKISDYQGWARGLKKAGYATDPKYPDKLISLIERFDLWQYDQGGALAQPSNNLDHQNPDETINASTINGKNRVYVVVAGDTLYSLSKRFGLTVDQIKEHNKLESIDLSIGQELKLPE
ncbi:glucosaminidase domain-containing protein [Flavobacteriaceae bacterium]|nr:glucosaminidase domain-containing protein [Flavobacteriaceae bacterium]